MRYYMLESAPPATATAATNVQVHPTEPMDVPEVTDVNFNTRRLAFLKSKPDACGGNLSRASDDSLDLASRQDGFHILGEDVHRPGQRHRRAMEKLSGPSIVDNT